MRRHRISSQYSILSSLVLALLLVSRASAVILYSSPDRNTSEPGSLDNRGTWGSSPSGPDDPRRLLGSGWQLEGDFRGFLATPIAPNYFITAKHIGGEQDATNFFVWNGVTYTSTTATGMFDSPNSDLRIWKINETFPTWAPLYSATSDGSEIGKSLVVIGRGTPRGAEVRTSDGALKGWLWGPDDRVRSWGENVVSGFDDFNTGDQKLLAFDFDASGGPNESILSVGDSGGGVFIQSGGVWKLAGINFGVVDPWHFDQGGVPGPQFDAAIFDAGGLWVGGNNPQFIPDEATDIPAFSASTRIGEADNLAWIHSIIGNVSAPPASVPEPTVLTLLGAATFSALLRRRSPYS